MIFDLTIFDNGGKRLFAVRANSMDNLEAELGTIERTIKYKRELQKSDYTVDQLYTLLKNSKHADLKDCTNEDFRGYANNMFKSSFHPYWKYIN